MHVLRARHPEPALTCSHCGASLWVQHADLTWGQSFMAVTGYLIETEEHIDGKYCARCTYGIFGERHELV